MLVTDTVYQFSNRDSCYLDAEECQISGNPARKRRDEIVAGTREGEEKENSGVAVQRALGAAGRSPVLWLIQSSQQHCKELPFGVTMSWFMPVVLREPFLLLFMADS